MTTPVTREEFDALTLRLEAVEAFILRRPVEPIPQPIIDAAVAAQAPPAEEQPTNEEPDDAPLL